MTIAMNWTNYAAIMVILTGAYYLIIALLFYKAEIHSFFSCKIKSTSIFKKKKDS